jgi:hypothetical protein
MGLGQPVTNLQPLNDAIHYLQISPPDCAMTPPSSQYWLNTPYVFVPSPPLDLFRWGLTSNGRHLFALTTELILWVWPIHCDRLVGRPLRRRVALCPSNSCSLIADLDSLHFYDGDTRHIASIADLLLEPSTIRPSASQLSESYFSVVGDGIVTVRMTGSGHITLKTPGNDGERQVQLLASRAINESSVSTIIPPSDRSLFETNGCFLAMIVGLPESASLFRVFSLISGPHVVMKFSTSVKQSNRLRWTREITVMGLT